MIAFRHIWRIHGLWGSGGRVAVPYSAVHVSAPGAKAMHAVAVSDALSLAHHRRTMPTACGLMRGARLTTVPSGLDDIEVLPLWPPYAAAGDHGGPITTRLPRCRACWEATGRKRPHAMWRTAL